MLCLSWALVWGLCAVATLVMRVCFPAGQCCGVVSDMLVARSAHAQQLTASWELLMLCLMHLLTLFVRNSARS
jgi:hypothetical protein